MSQPTVSTNDWLQDVDKDRQRKWERGRSEYGGGPDFVGDPLLHLYEELLDAINYIDEFERQDNTGMQVFWNERHNLWRMADKVRKMALEDSGSSLSCIQHTSTEETGPSTQCSQSTSEQLKSLWRAVGDLSSRITSLKEQLLTLQSKNFDNGGHK